MQILIRRGSFDAGINEANNRQPNFRTVWFGPILSLSEAGEWVYIISLPLPAPDFLRIC